MFRIALVIYLWGGFDDLFTTVILDSLAPTLNKNLKHYYGREFCSSKSVQNKEQNDALG